MNLLLAQLCQPSCLLLRHIPFPITWWICKGRIVDCKEWLIESAAAMNPGPRNMRDQYKRPKSQEVRRMESSPFQLIATSEEDSMSLLRSALYVLIAAVVGVSSPPLLAAEQSPVPKLRHGYTDMRYGQLHYSVARPVGESTLPPIVLLHQSPNSSVEFDALVAELGKERIAIAVDTPGYGGSDGPQSQPTIEDYAGAIAEGLKNMGYGSNRPVDIFGYHTGSKIATELAVIEPNMIRRVVLSGIYVVSEEERQNALKRLVHPKSAMHMFERFCSALPKTAEYYRSKGVPEDAWGRIRVDSMRPITRQEYGHEAAFVNVPQFVQRMGQIKQTVLLVPMDDGLANDTRNAKTRFAHVSVNDETFEGGGFFTQAPAIAKVLNDFSRKPAS